MGVCARLGVLSGTYAPPRPLQPSGSPQSALFLASLVCRCSLSTSRIHSLRPVSCIFPAWSRGAALRARTGPPGHTPTPSLHGHCHQPATRARLAAWALAVCRQGTWALLSPPAASSAMVAPGRSHRGAGQPQAPRPTHSHTMATRPMRHARNSWDTSHQGVRIWDVPDLTWQGQGSGVRAGVLLSCQEPCRCPPAAAPAANLRMSR